LGTLTRWVLPLSRSGRILRSSSRMTKPNGRLAVFV
jgi:hypothetical protein